MPFRPFSPRPVKYPWATLEVGATIHVHDVPHANSVRSSLSQYRRALAYQEWTRRKPQFRIEYEPRTRTATITRLPDAK